jgi:hypothetical protein
VECNCGALVIDERRTCPQCGRVIHPDAPVEIAERSHRGQPNVHVARRTISKSKRLATLSMFSSDQVSETASRETIVQPGRMPKWQGKELIEAVVELRGSANRITEMLRWDFYSYHLALLGKQQDGQSVQIALSKSFTLTDPDKPSADAVARLDDFIIQAMHLGFEQRPALANTPWFTIRFRLKIGWLR